MDLIEVKRDCQGLLFSRVNEKLLVSCQGTNCRSNVGKRAPTERLFVRGYFLQGLEGEREVLQDKHGTNAGIIKALCLSQPEGPWTPACRARFEFYLS